MKADELICAGCDGDGRVRLWITDRKGRIRENLTNENWPQLTAELGYSIGEMVVVALQPNPDK